LEFACNVTGGDTGGAAFFGGFFFGGIGFVFLGIREEVERGLDAREVCDPRSRETALETGVVSDSSSALGWPYSSIAPLALRDLLLSFRGRLVGVSVEGPGSSPFNSVMLRFFLVADGKRMLSASRGIVQEGGKSSKEQRRTKKASNNQ
jgi:hypothetical protein